MREGTVLRKVGGFVSVAVEGGEWLCVPRGRLKRDGALLLAGDRVRVSPTGPDQGVVEEVLPRRNQLIRPAVANVDQVVVVVAAASPPPVFPLLDRILVQVEVTGLTTLLCCNKVDLVEREAVDAVFAPYRATGYPLLATSAKSGLGVDSLREHLEGKVSTFAGPSGVGKSSLLNALEPALMRETGEVAERIQRGRHTTRAVELLRVGTGLVADTPGFSQLAAPEVSPWELGRLFPEFREPAAGCRFDDCLHRAEPGCAVRGGVDRGEIHPSRYESYLLLLEEIIRREEERY